MQRDHRDHERVLNSMGSGRKRLANKWLRRIMAPDTQSKRTGRMTHFISWEITAVPRLNQISPISGSGAVWNQIDPASYLREC